MKSTFWARVYFALIPVAILGCTLAVGLAVAMVAR